MKFRDILFFLLSILLLSSCEQTGNSILIGFSGQLSGPGSTPSTMVRNAVILAAEQINERGGINGRPIELLIKNDRGIPDQALKADRELFAAGVELIIGHTTSTMSTAVLDYINENEIVMLSPTSSAAYLMEKDDYFFSIFPSNRQLAEASAEFACANFEGTEITAIVDSFNSIYTVDYSNHFRRSIEAYCNFSFARLDYDSTMDPDFRMLLNEALNLDPDILMLVSGSLDTAMMVQQLYKRGLNIPVIGVEWAENQELIDQGGPYVENIYISNLTSPGIRNTKSQKFRTEYFQRFNTEALSSAVMGYEAMLIAAEALERKKAKQSLKEVLLGTTFQGLQDNISFDAYGDVNRRIYIHSIREGRFITVQSAK